MIPEEPLDETSDGISRRRMLKRIGGGMAIAWTAPVLTSMRTPAFAQSPGCEVFSCAQQQRCGATPGCPANPPGCSIGGCFQLKDRSCACTDNAFCGACSSDADCAGFGPGFRCAPINPDCLCPGDTACVLPCGSGVPAPRNQRSLVRG
jgi:hypothetical protein